MLGLQLSWWFYFTIGSIVGGWTFYQHRPNVAVGVCAAIGLLAPTWVYIGTEPYVFDVRMSLASAIMIAYCFHPLGLLRYPQHWIDGIVLAIIGVQIISDLGHGSDVTTTVLRGVGEWAVPYLAGRCSVLFRGSVSFLAPWFCGVLVILATGAVLEAFTGVNLFELIFSAVDDVVNRTRDKRYGVLFRAVGPTRHPIFFAILFLLFIPWTIAMIDQGRTKLAKGFGWTALAFAILGMITTVSRGPLLALAIAGVTAMAIRWPRVRPYVVFSAIAVVLTGVFFGSELVGWVEKSDTGGGRGKLVNVDEEGVVYTGTRNRILVWQIYGPLVVRGGLFGYGSAAVNSFPPNIAGLPKAAHSAEVLGIVDNSYLLLGLRFGWVGLSLYVALLLASIVTAISHRRAAGMIFYPHGSAFLTAVAAVLVGVAFEIMTVFLSYEFGFWILFTCGISAGTASLHRRLLAGATE